MQWSERKHSEEFQGYLSWKILSCTTEIEMFIFYLFFVSNLTHQRMQWSMFSMQLQWMGTVTKAPIKVSLHKIMCCINPLNVYTIALCEAKFCYSLIIFIIFSKKNHLLWRKKYRFRTTWSNILIEQHPKSLWVGISFEFVITFLTTKKYIL